MAARAAGTTPRRTPSRPACTAATTPATGSASSTGTQSATSTQSTSPGVAVTSASTSATGFSSASSTIATPVPCTWLIQTSWSVPTPSSRASRSRLAATSAGWSPTCPPRLNESYGDAERPPRRSVTTRRGRTAVEAAGPELTAASLGAEELGDVQLLLEVLRRQRPAGTAAGAGDRRQRRHGDAAALRRLAGLTRARGGRRGRRRGRRGLGHQSLAGLRRGRRPAGRRRRRGRRGRGCRRSGRQRRAAGVLALTRLALVEPGGDHRHPHLVTEGVVDDGPEDDVGVRV